MPSRRSQGKHKKGIFKRLWMTKLVFIKKENKKTFLNFLGGPITFYQKGGHVLQKEEVWSPYRLIHIGKWTNLFAKLLFKSNNLCGSGRFFTLPLPQKKDRFHCFCILIPDLDLQCVLPFFGIYFRPRLLPTGHFN